MILVISQMAMARGDRIGNGLGELLELATNTRADAAQLTLLEKLIIAFEQSEGNIPDLSKFSKNQFSIYGYPSFISGNQSFTWIMVPQQINHGNLVDLGEKSFYISSQDFQVENLTGSVPFAPPIYRLNVRKSSGYGFDFIGALAQISTGLTSSFGSRGSNHTSRIEIRQYGNFLLMSVLPATNGECYSPLSYGRSVNQINTVSGYCGIAYAEIVP